MILTLKGKVVVVKYKISDRVNNMFSYLFQMFSFIITTFVFPGLKMITVRTLRAQTVQNTRTVFKIVITKVNV